MISEADRKELKEKLLKMEADLKEQLEEIADKDEKEEGGYKTRFPNLGREDEDNIEEIEEYDRSVSLEHSLEKELEKVRVALSKVDSDPSYGICENCGEEISLERLRIMPHATECIKCSKK